MIVEYNILKGNLERNEQFNNYDQQIKLDIKHLSQRE